MKKIAILGSTGSIGTQALDVIRQHKDLFEAHTLTAGNNAELLVQQAREFSPDTIVIANESKYNDVKEALADTDIKVYCGEQALCEVVENKNIDIVLTAMVGFAGLRPTVNSIKAHKTIALANKETLVVAGELITQLAFENQSAILPVDSEHSAIFQSLVGENNNPIEKILLTASGGPFRKVSLEEIKNATAAQALHHPNWKMGAKITIDSASMMNKGFEMIEARWLYNVQPQNIEIIVQPESIIHSAVQFEDGAIIAQLGIPDMRLPIQYAFSFPHRLPLSSERLDLFAIQTLHFERADRKKFPCIQLAYDACRRGGNVPCIMNAANEIANLAFRENRIGFLDIPHFIFQAMENVPFIASPTLDDYFETDRETRQFTKKLIKN